MTKEDGDSSWSIKQQPKTTFNEYLQVVERDLNPQKERNPKLIWVKYIIYSRVVCVSSWCTLNRKVSFWHTCSAAAANITALIQMGSQGFWWLILHKVSCMEPGTSPDFPSAWGWVDEWFGFFFFFSHFGWTYPLSSFACGPLFAAGSLELRGLFFRAVVAVKL